jgi:hypothetical protein
MTSKSKSKKHILGYAILTTSELNGKVYVTTDFTIEGSFVRFNPQYQITKGSRTKLEGTQLILPERVIKEIIYQEIISY